MPRALEQPNPGLSPVKGREKGLEPKRLKEKEVKKSRIPKWITGYF